MKFHSNPSLPISHDAPFMAKCCVAAHNLSQNRAWRLRGARLIMTVVIFVWGGLFFWAHGVKHKYDVHKQAATDLLSTFEAAGKAVVVTDGAGDVLLSTGAANRLVGKEAVGGNIAAMYPLADEPLKAAMSAAKSKPDGHAVSQVNVVSPDNPDKVLQITATASILLEKPVVVVTISPLDTDASHWETVPPRVQ